MNENMFEEINKILDDPLQFEEFKNTMGITEDMLNSSEFSGNNNNSNNVNNSNSSSNSGFDFSNIDFNQIMGMANLFQSSNGGGGGGDNNQNSVALLLALKPFLQVDRQPKVDTAISILKILEMLPLLSNLNLFGGKNTNENQ